MNPARPTTQTLLPIVRKLPAALDVRHCLQRLDHLDHLMLMESSMRHETLGRYSFLMADPVRWIQGGTIAELRDVMPEPLAVESPSGVPEERCFRRAKGDRGGAKRDHDELPPFTGGLAGFISYDYNRQIEAIAPASRCDFPITQLAFGLYDVVVAFDHATGEAWLISNGFDGSDSSDAGKNRAVDRVALAHQRLEFFDKLLSGPAPPKRTDNSIKPDRTRNSVEGSVKSSVEEFETEFSSHITSNFSREAYLATVQKCIDYIEAGDVFQINLAQRLLAKADCDSIELYERLRKHNPATFSCFFDLGETQIVSSSPERLISLRDRDLETRPIKGTRPRTNDPKIDLPVSQQLLASEKDRAENVMIVDLMRNDLSRVCEDDSIAVTQLCGLEKYQSVFHLVSVIQGRLAEGRDVFDVLEATFPGGSITGAPKVRAMEIIAELEPTARGAYCGSIGYIDMNGDADFNILIRSITASGGMWQIPVGGGLVAQSTPEREYEETWTKAQGMLNAVTEGRA